MLAISDTLAILKVRVNQKEKKMKSKARTEAINKGLKYYYTGSPCKYGHMSKRYTQSRSCVQCKKLHNRKYTLNNLESTRASARKYAANKNLSEGYCVYKATYPSGLYIGSGQTAGRRQQHLHGNCTISRKIEEKATDFQVVLIGSKDYCREVEIKLIRSIGLNKLLNVNGGR